jgi:type VI secretion system protein ImpJ
MHAHEIPHAVQWHEGMLLAPHHFQQLASRQEAQIQYHLTALAPFQWGIRSLQIDTNLLVSGTLRIVDLEAILPDGLIVSYDANSEDPLELDLTKHADELAHKPIYAYLVVAVRKSQTTKGDLERYVSFVGDEVVDENTGSGAVQIPRLKPQLSLILNEILPAKYVGFPLLQISYRNEAYALTDYITPTPSVSPSSAIGGMCSAVARRLREKAMFLAEQARTPTAAVDIPHYIRIQTILHGLVAGLPHFEAVLSTGISHPFLLYTALCTIVGHLSTSGSNRVPPMLDPYDHTKLRDTFEQAQDFIFQVIAEAIPEAYLAVPFHYEDGEFMIQFDEQWRDRRLILGIRGSSGSTKVDMLGWGSECLIGSQSKIEMMRNNRVLGAKRDILEIQEDLPLSPDIILFALENDPEYIVSNERLNIFNIGDEQAQNTPAEIILYVAN